MKTLDKLVVEREFLRLRIVLVEKLGQLGVKEGKLQSLDDGLTKSLQHAFIQVPHDGPEAYTRLMDAVKFMYLFCTTQPLMSNYWLYAPHNEQFITKAVRNQIDAVIQVNPN